MYESVFPLSGDIILANSFSIEKVGDPIDATIGLKGISFLCIFGNP